jgi:Ca-activated chloride channel homolog
VRGLLRRRRRIAVPGRLISIATVLAVLAVAAPAHAGPRDEVAHAARITSPLGRTGLDGRIRIVARVTAPEKASVPTVRFYVNGELLATDSDGAPYVAEWEDLNPFEACALSVEADFGDTLVVRDEVKLEPLELIETAQVMSVGLEATIVDARGRYITALEAADFELREDGRPQTIDTVSSEPVPATFTLLIDTSQSMSRSMGMVRKAAARLSDHLRDIDSIVVAPFKTGIVSITGPTRDHVTVADAVTAIQPKGGTAILDSLISVVEQVSLTDRRVIVLVTDGYDEASESSIDAALPVLKRTQATVYVIAVGGVAGVSLHGEALLRRLAEETGGRAFFPWNSAELTAAHLAIAEDARSRYRLAYTPTNQRWDGTWRKIELAVKDPTHRVRARPGYTAPAPPPVRASIEFTAVNSAQQLATLTRDDLKVLEDGVAQQVDVFQEATAPVSIMLALDGSGSMKRAAPVVQQAVLAFVGALRSDDPLGLLVFADAPVVAHGFSLDRSQSARTIGDYTTKGGTALYDGLYDGLGQLATREGRRVLVVMSDGRDENAQSTGPGSTRTWDDVLKQARDIDATVYVVGLGSKVDRARLEQIAAVTGGEAYFTGNASELEQHYRRILEELRRRYLVAYTSTNAARDGKWRKVEIAASATKVRSRGGYYAPPQ